MATLSSPTLQNMLHSVRNRLNQPNSANSFWSDEELTEYINDAIQVYFLELVQNNEGYFTIQTDLNIVTDTETVALPTDCFQVRALYKKVSNGYEILPYRNTFTESYSTQGGTSSDSFLPSYYFRANNIVLRPIPNFSETAGLRLEYTQFPDTLVNGGDTMTAQVAPVFKQVIQSYAVYQAKVKESLVNNVNVHAVAAAHLNDLVAQFRDVMPRRSKSPTAIIPFNPEGGF
jgi:hypothetical protein